MNIPQAELDKLNKSTTEGIFDENENNEDEAVIEEQIKPQVEEPVSASTEEDAVADKARVPYSRFESVHERAIRAEERLKLLEEERASSKTSEVSTEIQLPEEWVELYGDSDAAKRAYGLQVKLNERLQEEATNKVLEQIKNKDKEEQEFISKNIEEIDNSLIELSNNLGRKLSETEESAILDIQDEFTPKDNDGKYIAPLLSPEKAFEIYSLRQEKAKVAKTQARNRVVSITSATSEGDISNSSADYRPNQWGSWRDKL